MGTAILDLKLAQELASVDQDALFLVFLDIRKSYNNLNCGRLLQALGEYGAELKLQVGILVAPVSSHSSERFPWFTITSNPSDKYSMWYLTAWFDTEYHLQCRTNLPFMTDLGWWCGGVSACFMRLVASLYRGNKSGSKGPSIFLLGSSLGSA